MSNRNSPHSHRHSRPPTHHSRPTIAAELHDESERRAGFLGDHAGRQHRHPSAGSGEFYQGAAPSMIHGGVQPPTSPRAGPSRHRHSPPSAAPAPSSGIPPPGIFTNVSQIPVPGNPPIYLLPNNTATTEALLRDILTLTRDNCSFLAASVEQQRLLIENLTQLNQRLMDYQQERHAEVRGLYARIDLLRDDLNTWVFQGRGQAPPVAMPEPQVFVPDPGSVQPQLGVVPPPGSVRPQPQIFVSPPGHMQPQLGFVPPPGSVRPQPQGFVSPGLVQPQLGFIPPPGSVRPRHQGFVPPPGHVQPQSGFVPPPGSVRPQSQPFVPPPGSVRPQSQSFVPPPGSVQPQLYTVGGPHGPMPPVIPGFPPGFVPQSVQSVHAFLEPSVIPPRPPSYTSSSDQGDRVIPRRHTASVVMPSGPVVPDFRRYRNEDEEEDEGELEYYSESDSSDDTRTFRSPPRIVIPFSDTRIKLTCSVYDYKSILVLAFKSGIIISIYNNNNNGTLR